MRPVQQISSLPALLRALLVFSVCCFVGGLTQPVFSSTRFFFFHNDITLLGSITMLYQEGDIFLAIIILLFTVVVPLAKYVFLFTLLSATVRKTWVWPKKILGSVGKWSMLDVFVIALMIVTMKIQGGILRVELKTGTIFLALAVMSALIVSMLVDRIQQDSGGRPLAD